MDRKTLKGIIRKRNLSNISISDMANQLEISFEDYVLFEKGVLILNPEKTDLIFSILNITDLDIGKLPFIEKKVPKTPIGAISHDQSLGKPVLFFNHKFYYKHKSDIKITEKIEKEWIDPTQVNLNKPKIYLYAFMFQLVLVLLTYGIEQYALSNLFLSMIIPVTLLTYLHESHLPKTIQGYKIMMYFVVGGILSIGFTYIIRYFFGYPEGLIGDITTGFIEEFAKILVCLLIFSKLNIRYVTTGILIGFAVGAGFDAFETSDYGMLAFLENGSYDEMILNILSRSIYALFGIGHHFWTGILAGTLVIVNQNTKISINDLFKPAFITMFILISLIHAFWNFSTTQPIGLDLIMIIFSLFIFIKFLSVHMQKDHRELNLINHINENKTLDIN